MKKLLAYLLTLALLLGVMPSALAADFSATVQGFGGDVTVTLTVEEGVLTGVTVTGDMETEGIGTRAMTTMPQAMVDANAIAVDGVSGATITSEAIKDAAAKALALSGATLTAVEVDSTLAMTPGVYTGKANGMCGELSVEITVTESAITGVSVGDNSETVDVGTLAFPILSSSIVENQSLIDTVSGATFTSNGIHAAVEDAMAQAGASPAAIAAFAANAVAYANPGDTQTDVVVVGAGLAGMVAAMKVKDAGQSVILLEKTGMTGGSARLSHSAIWGIGVKETAAIYDFNATEVYGFFNKQACPVRSKDVFYKLAGRTGEGIDYIKENGFRLGGTEPSHGKQDARFNAVSSVGFGPGLCEDITRAVEAHEIDLRYNTSMTDLIKDAQGAITGVSVDSNGQQYTITAKKVILATGGFTYNEEMLAQYGGGFDANNMLISAIGGTGDGHIAGTNAGGYLVGEGTLALYCVDGMPECFFNEMGTLFMMPIIVDDDGDQLAAMDEHYSTICKKMTLLNGGHGYTIHGSDLGDTVAPLIEKLVETGEAVKADTIAELAAQLGMDADRLNATIDNHNRHFDEQTTDEWTTAASALIPIKEGPFYAYRMRPTVMGTITGLAVNDEMQVMTESGQPIANLYAIGELMFGNIFNDVYPMSGTALTMCITGGMVSAEHAVANID